MSTMMLWLLQAFALQVLNKDSYINEGDDVQRAMEEYLAAMKSGKSSQRKVAWRDSKCLPSTQAFPPRIAPYVFQ